MWSGSPLNTSSAAALELELLFEDALEVLEHRRVKAAPTLARHEREVVTERVGAVIKLLDMP